MAMVGVREDGGAPVVWAGPEKWPCAVGCRTGVGRGQYWRKARRASRGMGSQGRALKRVCGHDRSVTMEKIH